MKLHRKLPPAGYRVPLSDIARSAAAAALMKRGCREELLDEVARALGVPYAYGVSSGKAALTTILRALQARSGGRRKVILPAYTCYSVPSAIVKAGLVPVPSDLGQGTFDYDYSELTRRLGPDVLGVLSVDLFGIPSDTARLVELCRPLGIHVVEDAAQAFGIKAGDEWLGTRADAGFYSFGRGKNITSGSGGIIVTRSPEIAAALHPLVTALEPASARDGVRELLTLTLLSVFISPRLYFFPSGLPFLRIGETIFHDDFRIAALSGFQARLLRDWQGRLEELNAVRRDVARLYLNAIPGARAYGADIPYPRFPLLIEDPDARRELLAESAGRRLGISWMYPTSVGAIPQLAERLSERVFPRAEAVAASLVTLPTHPLLTEQDRRSIVEMVTAALIRTARSRPPIAEKRAV